MRWFRFQLALALFTLTACGGGGGKGVAGGGGGSPIPNTGQGWTVLVYVVADNDLEPFALLDLQEMAAVGSGNELRIIAQVDRSGGYTADAVGGVANWTSTKRFEVAQGSLREVQDLGELDMANPATLADFVRWGLTTYPGQRVALVLWDHGAGWVGFGVDETTGQGAILGLGAVAQGIQQGMAAANRTAKLDVIGFDACLMATFEVAESLKAYGTLLLASEETEPGHGWDYRSLAGTGAATTPEQLGRKIADGFLAQAADPAWKTSAQITLSLVDLTRLGPIETALAGLANSYPNGNALAGAPLTSLGSARGAALAFGASPNPAQSSQLVDLIDLFGQASSVTGASAVATAVAGAVLYQVRGSATAQAGGLAIYFPADSTLYNGTAYDALPGLDAWRAFLAAVYGGGASATVPLFDNATIGLQATAGGLSIFGNVTAGTISALADIFLVYGIRDGVNNDGPGAFLLGENEGSLSGSTAGGSWDWTALRLSQGAYAELGYLSLRSMGTSQGAATIPFIYESGATQRNAFRLIVFDLATGNIASDTYYVQGAGGAIGELSPATGSKLRAVVAYLPDASIWESGADRDTRQWIPYNASAAGFTATTDIAIDFMSFASGDPYYALLRIANAGGVGDWIFTNPTAVVP